jgi:hypothetical protein
MINFLKEECGAWLRKRWKFDLVSSLSVVFFCFLALSELWGKKLTVNLIIYDIMEVRSADTVPWLEVGL